MSVSSDQSRTLAFFILLVLGVGTLVYAAEDYGIGAQKPVFQYSGTYTLKVTCDRMQVTVVKVDDNYLFVSNRESFVVKGEDTLVRYVREGGTVVLESVFVDKPFHDGDLARSILYGKVFSIVVPSTVTSTVMTVNLYYLYFIGYYVLPPIHGTGTFTVRKGKDYLIAVDPGDDITIRFTCA